MSGNMVLQYKTNNDGTVNELLSGPTVAPEIKAAAQAALADGIITPEEQQQIDAVIATSGQLVFVAQNGDFYRAAVRKSPFDSYVPFPAQIVVDTLDEPMHHEALRDKMLNYAAANGTAYDPQLAAANPYVSPPITEENK
jgi:hypothetical protein